MNRPRTSPVATLAFVLSIACAGSAAGAERVLVRLPADAVGALSD